MQNKKYLNGTHRVCDPHETMDKINPFLKSLGITRTANITGLDNIGIPVFATYRPNSKSLSTSQGKGHSPIAAKVSSIMESIEGYHAENTSLPTIYQSYDYLKKNNYSIVNIEKLAKSCENDFHHKDKIQWVECTVLKSKKAIWSPIEVIHADFRLPQKKGSGFFIADSNGLASGNTVLEAINHGLFEVIERDCMALWQLTPKYLQNKKRIDVDTITDGFLREKIDLLLQKNILIALWDITADTCVPTFICKIISSTNTGVRPAYGSGTHLDKNIALSRAITEAAQSRLTFISGARDDQFSHVYETEISPVVYKNWINEISTFKKSDLISFSSITSSKNQYLEDDTNQLITQLQAVGIDQIYYADLTKEEYNIPVVKVVVPGLEGVTYPGRRVLQERGVSFYKKYGVGACEKI